MKTPKRENWAAVRLYLSVSKAVGRNRSSSRIFPWLVSSYELWYSEVGAEESVYVPCADALSEPRILSQDRLDGDRLFWKLIPFSVSALTSAASLHTVTAPCSSPSVSSRSLVGCRLNVGPGAAWHQPRSPFSFPDCRSSVGLHSSTCAQNERDHVDEEKERALREDPTLNFSPGEGAASGRDDHTPAAHFRSVGAVYNHQTGRAAAAEREGEQGSETGWTREEVLNWPNAISMARLLSGPLLAWMILQGLPRAALLGLALAGASDWLDGYVARRLGVNSVLGSYLDPLADKVLVGSIALSMAYAGLLHPALVALIVARDGVLLGGSFLYRAYTLRWQWSGWGEFFKIGAGGAEKVEPLLISKINMVLQLALIGTALIHPALGLPDSYSLVPLLSWSVVATTTMSWIGYAWIYLRRPNPAALVGGVTHLPLRKSSHASGRREP